MWLSTFIGAATARALTRMSRSVSVVMSLVAYGVGGLLAAAVHPGQLEAGPLGYLAVLMGVMTIAGLALVRGFRQL